MERSFTIGLGGIRTVLRRKTPPIHSALKLVQAASGARATSVTLCNSTLANQFSASFSSTLPWWNPQALKSSFHAPLDARPGPCRDLALAFLLFDFEEMIFSGPDGGSRVSTGKAGFQITTFPKTSQEYEVQCRAHTAIADPPSLLRLLRERATYGRVKVCLNGRELETPHQVALVRSFLDTAPPQLHNYTRTEECWVSQKLSRREPLFLVSQPSGTKPLLKGAVFQLHDRLEGKSHLTVLKNDVVVGHRVISFPYGALALVDGSELDTDPLGLCLNSDQIRSEIVREIKTHWRQLMRVSRASLSLVPKPDLRGRFSSLLANETSGRRLSLVPYIVMPLLGKTFVLVSLFAILWARCQADDPICQRGTDFWSRSVGEALARVDQEFDRYGRPSVERPRS